MNIKEAIQQINYAAENAHRRYLTFGYSFMLLYNEKIEEATDYIVDKYPKHLKKYPLIEAEAKATGKEPKEVADNIIEQRKKWINAAAKIEKLRFEGKTKISENPQDINKIVKEIIKKLDKI